MKTMIPRLGYVLGLLLMASNIHAATYALPDEFLTSARHSELERAVQHQINRFVIFPLSEDADSMYGVVDIAYVVNTEGQVVVVSSESQNHKLRDYVVRKLARIKVGANPSGLWNMSRVRFTFRPE